jgi:hypothetical protein
VKVLTPPRFLLENCEGVYSNTFYNRKRGDVSTLTPGPSPASGRRETIFPRGEKKFSPSSGRGNGIFHRREEILSRKW